MKKNKEYMIVKLVVSRENGKKIANKDFELFSTDLDEAWEGFSQGLHAWKLNGLTIDYSDGRFE